MVRAGAPAVPPPRLGEERGVYRTRASLDGQPGDRRVGAIWHTQGSGKSLTMAFYAGQVMLHPAMANPTLVVITDRNDLDDQLFGVFARCHELLRQHPVQAQSRVHLRKLLQDEIRTRGQHNVVQARSFAALLETAIKRYQNRAIEAAAVIEELIALAREMREADRRGEALGLTAEEVAFYDALEVNDSAVKILGDETLRAIAQELARAVRNNVTIDWTLRENVRAKMRVLVKRILRRYGYPPDKQEKATQTVLEQAEVLAREWTVA